MGCPVIVYNNPLYTGNPMSPQVIAQAHVGEEHHRREEQLPRHGPAHRDDPPFAQGQSLCTGIDSQFYPALCVGASGLYSTAACIVPAQMVKLYDLTIAGKHAEALALSMKLQTLNRYLEYDPGYVAPAKEALNLLGLPGGYLRGPLPQLTSAEKAGVKAALKTIGVL